MNSRMQDLELWNRHAIRIICGKEEKWISGINFELKRIEKVLRLYRMIDENGIPIKGVKNGSSTETTTR